MAYLFTSESVSEGHPDKVADQISDALLDEFLRYDPNSHVACETLVTTGLTVCSGEVTTSGYVDVQEIARKTIKEIGYTNADYRFESESCGVVSTIHSQSADINQGVSRKKAEEQGAGDQGMMFGYACNETENLMPLTIDLAHVLLKELSNIRREGKLMKYLRPDAKSQVTVKYDDNGNPLQIDTIVISTQHDQFDKDDAKMLAKIEKDVKEILIPRVVKTLPKKIQDLFAKKYKLYVNPTGKFVIGGPHGDTGLTGRKIIVDTYGGHGAHGGGAFSGKDSSKVDRSAAYATRYIAKNLVAAGVCSKALVQVAYAIGVAKPVGLFINTYGTSKAKVKGKIISDGQLAEEIHKIVDLRPYYIIKKFGLKNPVFQETASYGHFGRKPYSKEVEVYYPQYEENGKVVKTKVKNKKYYKTVDFFAWEKTDLVADLKKSLLK
ncbi:S-adenosylmethionine synthase [Bacteroidia bacterium]|nr:S-adenosylmethionine synthase [Bacteroidia bacterium]